MWWRGIVIGLLLVVGCERDEGGIDKADVLPPAAERVVFPPAIQAADEVVNDFVRRSMETCISGDYEAFRLLWSVEHEPLSQGQFAHAWQAISRIEVMALEHDVENDTYAVYAEVHFDPDLVPPQHDLALHPQRVAVMLLIQEHDEWRLAKAPENVQAWLKDKVNGNGETSKRPNVKKSE